MGENSHLLFVLYLVISLSYALSDKAACSPQQTSFNGTKQLCGQINTTEADCAGSLGCCWETNTDVTENTTGTCYAPSSNNTLMRTTLAPTTNPGYRHCIVYDRNLCGTYLNQSMWEYRWTSRYIDSRVGLNQTESTVLKFMNQIEKIDPSFDKCKKILRTLLCQYTLVPCNGRGLPTPYCREDCEALFRQCEKPMIEIMGAAKVILSQLPPSKVSIGFPNCTALKYRHEYPTSSDEKCLHFGLFDLSRGNSSSVGYCEVYKRDLCLGSFNKTMLKYKDTPRFVDSRLGIEKTEEIVEKFIGIVDRMESKDEWCVGIIRSLICQYAFLPCNAQGLPIRTCREDCEVLFRDCDKPMSQVMGAAQYLFGHDKVQFFHIGLPNCTKLNYERELVNKTCVHFGVFDLYPRSKTQSNVVIIAVSVSAASFVVFLVVIAVIRRIRKRSLDIKRGYQGVTFTAVSMRDRLRADSIRMLDQSKIMSLFNPDDITQYPLDRVEYVKDLGQGNFGNVFQGRAFGLVGEKPDTEIMVAVKTLKEGSSKETKESFFQEVAMMSLLNHDNIVQLLGVSTEEEPYGMIFEFMNMGDLNQYLRNAVSYSELATSGATDENKVVLKPEDLLMICMQITLGMEHLQTLRFVHRDLATRNLLVSDNGDGLVVKIADFGMSRDIYASDYYKVEGQAALPIRWLPPEALLYGKFTVESDVYTYGVVLWEVYTFALQPYYGYTNDEVVEFIKKGVHLGKPDECPGYIYTVMKSCWKKDPAQRPNFSTILAMLNQSQEVLALHSKDDTLSRNTAGAVDVTIDNSIESHPLYENTKIESSAANNVGNYKTPIKSTSGFTNLGFAPTSPTVLNTDQILSFPSADNSASYMNVNPVQPVSDSVSSENDPDRRETNVTRGHKGLFSYMQKKTKPDLEVGEVQV